MVSLGGVLGEERVRSEVGSHIAVKMLLEVGEVGGELIHSGSLLGGCCPAECHGFEPETTQTCLSLLLFVSFYLSQVHNMTKRKHQNNTHYQYH